MYKKYINRKGKRTGPYYYESLRLKNGRIKTIYLGKTPDQEKLAKAIARLKVDVEEVIVKGETTIIPVSVESRVVKDALALSEIFKDAVVQVEKKFVMPTFRLPKIEFNKINFFELFRKGKQQTLENFVPKPGNLDFNFEILLFLLVAVAYVFGFFYLEASLTSLAVLKVDILGKNFLPVIMGVVNLLLLIRIYIDFRGGKGEVL